MRKLNLWLFIVLIALLAGCGSGMNYAGDTHSSGDGAEEQNAVSKEKAESDNFASEEDENTVSEESDTSNTAEEASEPQLDIVQSTGGAWQDSIDNVWVHSAAIFENTGDVPVQIGETQMNFTSEQGDILGTAAMIYSVPEVVLPGERAFIGETTTLEGVTDPEEYEETTYNFSFDVTDEDPHLLEVAGIKGTPGKDEFAMPYTVTGVVKNTSDALQDDIRIAAALLAEDGTLLGVLTGSVTVGVNPGGEAGFELSYPEVPRDIVDKVETIEVQAYGWTW